MKTRVCFKTLLQVLLMALVLNAVALSVLPGILSANASEKSNGKRPTVLLILDGFDRGPRKQVTYTLREGGCLADIAPTLIEMMGMEKPEEMTGESLLVEKESPNL